MTADAKVIEIAKDVLAKSAPGIGEPIRFAIARSIAMRLRAELEAARSVPTERQADIAGFTPVDFGIHERWGVVRNADGHVMCKGCESYDEAMRRILALFHAAPARSVPAGWPEPTDEQVSAAILAFNKGGECEGYHNGSAAMRRALRAAAMLSSAPNPPAADARPCTCHPDDNPPKPCPRKFALTECRAAADAVVEALRKLENKIEWAQDGDAIRAASSLDEISKLVRALRAALTQAQASPPAAVWQTMESAPKDGDGDLPTLRRE